MTGYIAVVSTVIHHPIERVWNALVDPDEIPSYMMGARVNTDWKEGSPITWSGEWEGRRYVDNGTVLVVREPDLLKYTHASSTAHDPTEHTVTIELKEVAGITHMRLSQDGNTTEAVRDAAQEKWARMLDQLKVMLGEAPVPAPVQPRT